jgi:hypothetical protein
MRVHPSEYEAREIVVGAAREVLAGELGVLEAARVIAWYSSYIDPEQEDSDLLGIAGVESQTDHLLLGEYRFAWPPDVLVVKEAEIAEAEVLFGPGMLESCIALVRRYSPAG